MDRAMESLLRWEASRPMEPKEPQRVTLGSCKYCGEPVYKDEPRYDFDGTLFHAECLENFGVKELAEMFGYREVEP